MAGYRPDGGRGRGSYPRSPERDDDRYAGDGDGYAGDGDGYAGDADGYERDWRRDPGGGSAGRGGGRWGSGRSDVERGSRWDRGQQASGGRTVEWERGSPDPGWDRDGWDNGRDGNGRRDDSARVGRWERRGDRSPMRERGGRGTDWDRPGRADQWRDDGPETGAWDAPRGWETGEWQTGQWEGADWGTGDIEAAGWESASWDYSAWDREEREARKARKQGRWDEDEADRRWDGDEADRRWDGDDTDRRWDGDEADRRWDMDEADRRWDGPDPNQTLRLRGEAEQSDPTGGAEGNERLTGMTGAVLLVLFALEGITILRIHQLLTLHFFFGMLLVGPVALKVGSTVYRFFRYYTGSPEYTRKGPPTPLLRLLGPFVVLLSLTVVGSGVMLGLAGPSGAGTWLFVHKASFVLWFGAMTIHVLAYVWRLPQLISGDLAMRAGRQAGAVLAGRPARWLLLSASLLTGILLASMTVGRAGLWTGFLGG